MTFLSRFFWQEIHRSDRGAAARWCAFLFFIFASFPILGSVSSSIAIGGMFVSYGYIFFGRGKFFKLNDNEVIIAISFASYFLIQIIFAVLHENPMAGVLSALSCSAFFFVLPLFPVLRLLAGPNWETWVFRGIASGAILAGLVAIYASTAPGTQRVEALAGNALVFAYLAGAQSLLSGQLFFHVRGQERWLFALAAILGLIAVALSGSRAPLFEVILIAVIGIAWRAFARGFSGWRQALLMAYVAFVAVVGLYQFTWNTAAVMTMQSRLHTLFDVTTEADPGDEDIGMRQRLVMLRTGLEGFLDHPFAGYGVQNVMSVVETYAPEETFRYNHLHNAYVTDAVASGILGLLSFLAVSFAPMVAAFRKESIWWSLSLIFVVHNLLYHLTNIGFGHDIKSIYFCMFVVAVNAMGRPSSMPSPTTLASYLDFINGELAQSAPGEQRDLST